MAPAAELAERLAGVTPGAPQKSDVLRLQPPLMITEAQLDAVVGTVADGLAAFAAR